MQKNRKLNQWLWKWHFIAGLVSLPFVLLLAVTGGIYLFNPSVQSKKVSEFQTIEVKPTAISYQQQFEIAKKHMKKKPSALVLNEDVAKATAFITGRFSHKNSIFINPYTSELTGRVSPKDSWMYTIRKLHGELLGGSVGTKIIELIASWLVVLIITGLYVWYPFERGIKGVFTIRFKQGKQVLFRDMHAVTGFWISILLIVTLAGGFPWTDVFGSNFRKVQKITNTGYPKTWFGGSIESKPNGEPLSVDQMVVIARSQGLKGEISVGFPKNEKGVFSVSNRAFPLDAQQMLHFDQYSGALVKKHDWSDVGVLQRGRAWVMAFHQGQFNGFNWWIMFLLCIALTIMSASALLYYLGRKPKEIWGVPKVPKSFSVGKGIVLVIILLGVIFPMFGFSLIFVLLFEKLKSSKGKLQV